ncbi:hypothetical protein [Saccharibacillus qingshengii]|uniref:hypothetical protein n=1 Tax=Saccharibacillus qingshengii TaxID=1763540 RepID=UPI001552A8BE|nr:hypothetical protein [Saccharibacillus qingshengii]
MQGYDQEDAFYSIFKVSQTGIKFIIIMIIILIVLGLVAAFTTFRKNLTGPKIMALGIVFIGLSVVFASVISFTYLVQSLHLIILLVGMTLVFIGVCWKN